MFKNIIYYFILKTDTTFDKAKKHLDEVESKGDFELVYVPFDSIEDVLVDSIPDNEMNKIITEEMLEVINVVKTRTTIEFD